MLNPQWQKLVKGHFDKFSNNFRGGFSIDIIKNSIKSARAEYSLRATVSHSFGPKL
jgi:hypothetical protein